ncbi:radical SAM/SPASM domain-containing protein [Streptomyces aureus]|uniref:radical SAM/SPASM domain-containing protein n=1 Tax=Streptomyces aureus TaxID=193461 RepID=UPI000A8C7555|nr:radical SAM/SPASM domain-containing protein [Streptomyces aureus]
MPRRLGPHVVVAYGGDEMRLAEIIALRPVPAAGLLATLTRRCPLSCAHCSTSSGPRGEDTPGDALRRFVGGFAPADRPEVLMLTGGEPMLRPRLVADLAALASAAGTRTTVLSGMFFAGDGRVPARIMDALRHVDHFSASMDVFHEREVPRSAVFRAMHRIMDRGIDVSFHVTGTAADDAYLADVTTSIRSTFRDQAAVLVNHIRPVGRAAAWATARTVTLPGAGEEGGVQPPPTPCAMAAWPTVAFDGTVAACCNQRVVDARPVPRHLRLGHIAEDDWAAIHRRCRQSPVLRTIRTAGVGSCADCRALADRPADLATAERAGARPAAAAVDMLGARLQHEAGAAALLRRYGSERYAPLVLLGGGGGGAGNSDGAGGAAGPGGHGGSGGADGSGDSDSISDSGGADDFGDSGRSDRPGSPGRASGPGNASGPGGASDPGGAVGSSSHRSSRRSTVSSSSSAPGSSGSSGSSRQEASA